MGLAGEQRVVGKGVLRALQDLLRGLVSTLQRILSHYGVIGSLAFQQDLSNHSLKNGLDKAGSCKQAVYGGRRVRGRESERDGVARLRAVHGEKWEDQRSIEGVQLAGCGDRMDAGRKGLQREESRRHPCPHLGQCLDVGAGF